jgi:hypothetical protein
MAGNPITEDPQWRKLETVAKIAGWVWPRSWGRAGQPRYARWLEQSADQR